MEHHCILLLPMGRPM
uniref:Uncharacterized protein n=1 Tax=Arundo donax TaxID=35708 RepID=A0A0A9AE28_ARUDO